MNGLVSFISLVIVSFEHYLSNVSGLIIALKSAMKYTELRSDDFWTVANFTKIFEYLI